MKLYRVPELLPYFGTSAANVFEKIKRGTLKYTALNHRGDYLLSLANVRDYLKWRRGRHGRHQP